MRKLRGELGNTSRSLNIQIPVSSSQPIIKQELTTKTSKSPREDENLQDIFLCQYRLFMYFISFRSKSPAVSQSPKLAKDGVQSTGWGFTKTLTKKRSTSEERKPTKEKLESQSSALKISSDLAKEEPDDYFNIGKKFDGIRKSREKKRKEVLDQRRRDYTAELIARNCYSSASSLSDNSINSINSMASSRNTNSKSIRTSLSMDSMKFKSHNIITPLDWW